VVFGSRTGAKLLRAIPSYRRDHFCSQKHNAAAKTQHAPISGISEMNVQTSAFMRQNMIAKTRTTMLVTASPPSCCEFDEPDPGAGNVNLFRVLSHDHRDVGRHGKRSRRHVAHDFPLALNLPHHKP
jgi:hypothetical protein